MCKILLQAESHFMDFQGSRLAMLILQHGPYDIFSEKGAGLCWDSVRRTVWLNLSYPSGSKFWVGAIFWISVGQGYAWPWLCILFRPFQKMDCKAKLCQRLCGRIIFFFNHRSADEIITIRRLCFGGNLLQWELSAWDPSVSHSNSMPEMWKTIYATKSLCHGLTWAGHKVLTEPLYHSSPQLGGGEKKYHKKFLGQRRMG